VQVLAQAGRVRGLRCVRIRLGEPDASGRRRPEPIPGSDFDLDVDTVVPALGQEADLGCLPDDVAHERGTIAIELTGLTTRARVYAGGDAATGFGTVTAAIGSGKRAAIAIDRALRGEEAGEFPALNRNVHVARREMLPDVVSFEELNRAHLRFQPRPKDRQRDVAKRLGDFSESNPGLDEETIVSEGVRCFSCGTCNRCDNCLIFCPDISVGRRGNWTAEYPVYPFFEVDYDYCKGCGVCATECPRHAITMEEELLWKK
jgi:2-oxoacid:acceptor oxidoreductase delta subunit (pyruvate/2-ketoisovalerate family)